MVKNAVVVLMVMLCGSGCISTGRITLLNSGAEPGKERFYGTVRVFSHRDIGVEVIELGSVSVAIYAEVPGSQYISMIQKEAAKLGADAIVAYQQHGTTATGIAVQFVKKK